MRYTTIGFLFLCLLPAWGSTTRVVTTLADSGAGSLRDAMTQANGSSGDTISFARGLSGTILLQSPLPTVTQYMVINGPGAAGLAINGQGAYQCFSIVYKLDLSGVTIENCNSSLGAIYVASLATLNLLNANLKNNMSGTGGGAIFNNGSLMLAFVTLNQNSAANSGGALFNYGSVDLAYVTFNGNWSSQGGAIANEGFIDMSFSTLAGNYCRNGAGGGGVYNPGVFEFDHSTFINNSSTHGVSGGGAILNEGELLGANSTFWLNTADNDGGAIYDNGPEELTFVTIADNSAPGGSLYNLPGAVSLKATIVAHGSSGPNCNGSVVSKGYNLSDDSSCNLTGTGDINSRGASLDPTGPQVNGGITPTIALLPGSLAVNAIPSGVCAGIVTDDQRQVLRPQGSGCDIGAFELAALQNFDAKLGLITGLLGRFNLIASFSLDREFDLLDPTSSALTLRIGTYQVNLPAGSFHSIGSSVWAFVGIVNGTGVGIQIQSLGDEKYQLTAQGAPANLFGITSPTILSLTIGVYSGTIVVPFTPAI